MPTLRPSSVSFAFLTIDSAGDSSILTGSRPPVAFGGRGIASPSATRLASFSSTMRNRDSTRVRTCGKPTFDSSNTSAEAICACSISVCER